MAGEECDRNPSGAVGFDSGYDHGIDVARGGNRLGKVSKCRRCKNRGLDLRAYRKMGESKVVAEASVDEVKIDGASSDVVSGSDWEKEPFEASGLPHDCDPCC